MLRLIAYGRVSTDEQHVYGTGLETQRVECASAAQRLGAVLVGYEEDPGVSGSIYPREGMERALARIAKGEANGIIVHRVDRMGRLAYIPMVLWDRISNYRARLFSVQDGEVDDGNIIMFALRCAMAQSDYQQIVANLKAGKRRMAETGITPTRSNPPYGYHIVQKIENGQVQENPGTYRVIEEQAAVVRRIFRLYAAGLSLNAIIAELTAEGIPPPRKPAKRAQGEWIRSTVMRILDNSTYQGTAIWGRSEHKSRDRAKMAVEDTGRMHSSTGIYRERTALPPSAHIKIPVPAIIEPDLWQKCQQRRVENKTNTQRNDRRHLLTGMLFCPVCGLRLIVQGAKGEGRITYYKCPGNRAGAEKSPACARHYSEKIVLAALEKALRRLRDEKGFAAAAYAAHVGPDDTEAGAHLAAAQKRLAELQSREEATVRAQISAIQTGARSEIYEGLLSQISEERRKAEQAVERAAAARIKRRRMADIDVAAAASIVADAILEALRSPDLTDLEKNGALRRTVQSIIPSDGGYKITLRPFSENEKGLLVALVITSATSRELNARFEAREEN